MTDASLAHPREATALDAVVASQGPLSGRGWGFLPVAVSAFLAVSMVILRAADGPRVYFDGVVARGASVALWLMALPLSMKLSRAEGGPLDPGFLALAELRGVPSGKVWSSLAKASALISARRAAYLVGPLVVLSAVLSLPEAGLFGRRLVVGLCLLAIVSLSSAVLALLALAAARVAGPRGRAALTLALVVPWVLASLAGVEALSLPGAYDAAVDGVLSALAP